MLGLAGVWCSNFGTGDFPFAIRNRAFYPARRTLPDRWDSRFDASKPTSRPEATFDGRDGLFIDVDPPNRRQAYRVCSEESGSHAIGDGWMANGSAVYSACAERCDKMANTYFVLPNLTGLLFSVPNIRIRPFDT